VTWHLPPCQSPTHRDMRHQGVALWVETWPRRHRNGQQDQNGETPRAMRRAAVPRTAKEATNFPDTLLGHVPCPSRRQTAGFSRFRTFQESFVFESTRQPAAPPLRNLPGVDRVPDSRAGRRRPAVPATFMNTGGERRCFSTMDVRSIPSRSEAGPDLQTFEDSD
jgi:hypothetical protein